MFKNLFTSVVAATLVLQPIMSTAASAQTVPGSQPHHAPVAQEMTQAPVPNDAREQEYVMLSELVASGPGVVPRSAGPGDVRRDLPMLTRQQFLQRYPDAGNAAFDAIRSANEDLCNLGFDFERAILDLDQQFQASDNEYQQLMGIYEALPRDIKRGSRVMTIAQAGATGALCLMSAGLYCIAAILVGIGNIFTNAANRRLALANVRLSIANIRLTRINIASNRLTLQLDMFWLRLAIPYCQRFYPEIAGLRPAGTTSQFVPQSAVRPHRQ